MKLTTEQCMSIVAGLRSLDGYDRIIKDGERERAVKEFYKLGGGLRLLVAKWINRLDVIQAEYQKARNHLVSSFADAQAIVPPEHLVEFIAEDRKMLAAEEEVDLAPIKVDELKLDQNPIPATVLSLIQPVLAE